jgi:heme A synthase
MDRLCVAALPNNPPPPNSERQRSAWIVCALLLLTLATGAATIGSGMSLRLVVGHGVAAALLLAAVATLLKGQWGKREG